MTTMYRKPLVGLAIIIGMAISGSNAAANTVINISSIQQCATNCQISKISSIRCAETIRLGIPCADIECEVIEARIPSVEC